MIERLLRPHHPCCSPLALMALVRVKSAEGLHPLRTSGSSASGMLGPGSERTEMKTVRRKLCDVGEPSRRIRTGQFARRVRQCRWTEQAVRLAPWAISYDRRPRASLPWSAPTELPKTHVEQSPAPVACRRATD